VSQAAPKSKPKSTVSAGFEPTPKDLVDRAVALRPTLIEQQAEAEERTYYSQELHEAFQRAGFYQMFMPRRYGGYEVDVPTFMRVIVEIARGCPSTAWCLALASNHALMVGSWFPERAQDEVFAEGQFICASVAAPLEGLATPVEDGWELNGKVSYCSGIPYSTHFLGQALTPGESPGGPPGPMLLYVAPRGTWRMLDDWGDLLGLKGSGSQSIVFEQGRLPAHYVLESTSMIDIDPGSTPGYRLHGNPLYAGRALSVFTMCLASVLVGAAYNALDEYEAQTVSRMTPIPPIVPRTEDADFQRYFGAAWAKIATAEAALRDCAEQFMELCRRQAEEGIPFSYKDDMLLGCIGREVMIQTWETVQSDLVRTIGASLIRAGQRMERIYRDMSIGNAHRNTSLRDWAYRELACAHFDVPSPTMLLFRGPSARSREPVAESSN
jgi:3-hydroxy-9,10-secoandrosta-1,3,5(10)-triene-9,17-dione monooxygenase